MTTNSNATEAEQPASADCVSRLVRLSDAVRALDADHQAKRCVSSAENINTASTTIESSGAKNGKQEDTLNQVKYE